MRGPVSTWGCILGVALLLYALSTISSTSPEISVDASFAEKEAFWKKRFERAGPEVYAEFLEAGGQLEYNEAHTLSHVVGEALYEQFGEAGIRYCTTDFGYGCFHGVAGVTIAKKGFGALESIFAECAQLGNENIGCVHGVGHGILAYGGEESLKEALERCAPFHEAQGAEIAGCWGGVFMEYNFNTMRSEKGIALRDFDETQREEPCFSKVDERFQKACYYELPSWWRASIDKGDVSEEKELKRVGEWCASVKNSNFRQICFRGIGNMIGPRSDYKSDIMRAWCAAAGDTQDFAACYREALGHLLQSEEGKKQLAELCGNGLEFKEFCMAQ